MPYLYDDEDNVPMNDDALHEDPVLKYTTYSSVAEMKAADSGEPLPFTDPPEDGCWNCQNFDWMREACTTNWNNMDESYYNPDIDDRKPDDHCEYWELNPDAKWEDWHD